MRCRRCLSNRLLRLDKKWPPDNDIFRCQECGFLFSPSSPEETGSPKPGAGGSGPAGSPSRTVAVRSGYQDRQ